MRILAFTTSTPAFSAALVDGDDVLATGAYEHIAHAERMFAAIDELFSDHPKGTVDAIAVDVGPGSFTGVRVGLAAAKGLALGLGCPLVAVGSLEAMAHEAGALHPEADRVVTLLDAKRNELFVGCFDGAGRALEPARHVARDEAREVLAGYVAEGTVWCGERVEGLDVTWAEVAHPGAGAIAAIARRRPAADLDGVEPVYLRPPDAKKPQGLPKLARG